MNNEHCSDGPHTASYVVRFRGVKGSGPVALCPECLAGRILTNDPAMQAGKVEVTPIER